MQTVGRIENMYPYPGNETIVILKMDASAVQLDKYRDKVLAVNLKPYRKKRSTTSNGYYWILVRELCNKLRISQTEMHNRLLADYGQELIIDGVMDYSLKDHNFQWLRSEEGHYKPSGRSVTLPDGTVLDIYWTVRGSSTYNTEEMSILIDGAIQECKELGIETMTPEELQRLFAAEGNYAGNAEH